MKKILSAILSFSMILALVATMGFSVSAKDGDVLYEVNFKGDDKYAPAAFSCAVADSIDVVVSEDGNSVTATYKEGIDKGKAFWGGAIKGLTYGEGKQYTISMKMAVGYTDTDGNLASGNGGVFINMPENTDPTYLLDIGHKALVGYYGCPNIRHTLSWGAGGKSNGYYVSRGDEYITDAALLSTLDAEGFVDLTFAIDGTNVKVFINNIYFDEYDAFKPGVLEIAENVGFSLYLYNNAASITIKDAVIYEGITVKDATYPDYIAEGPFVTTYETSKTGDLLFTADFSRKDSGFNPRFTGTVKNSGYYTITTDAANTGYIKVENTANKDGTTYFGAPVEGLEVTPETRYTYDWKIKTSAKNAGFGFMIPAINPFSASYSVYGNYEKGSFATQHGANKITNSVTEIASNGYSSVSNLAVDADGYSSFRAEIHGYEVTIYYMSTEGNWVEYNKFDATHTTKNDGSAEYIHPTGFQLCVGLTLNNKGLVAEYKDINIYKGLLITDPEGKLDPVETEPEVTEPEVTEPADPVPTGDSALIFALIAVISLCGVAVVAKRREN